MLAPSSDACALAVVAALAFTVASADARSGSSGSRGSAHLLRAGGDEHRAARRADRAQHDAAAAPRAPWVRRAAQTARPGLFGGGLFGGGLLGGLAAGFLGAGLFGMLSGTASWAAWAASPRSLACCCRSCSS